MRERIKGVGPPGGSYRQYVRRGNLVFVSGMTGQDRQGRLVSAEVGLQTRQALRNIDMCLRASGGRLRDVCSVTAFLEHADRDFAEYDAAFAECFGNDPPARATVEAHIVGEAIVEIQAVAVLSGKI